jgi:hypothetical protein
MEAKPCIRSSLLGDQIAENDLFNIQDNFIETAAYRNILETKDATVVIGRRGTGKSAIFIKLQEIWKTQKNALIPISPEDQETIFFRSVLKYFGENYSLSRSASKLLIKYGFYLEIIKILSKHYKVKDAVILDQTINQELKKWESYNTQSYFTKLAKKVMEIKTKFDDANIAIGLLPEELKISTLESFITNNLKLKNNNICILLDKLDEGYENDELGASIVSGTILAGVEINKKFEKIRIVIFQRDNIIRSVARYDNDYTRNIEGELVRIHWDFHQLFNLIAKRLNCYFSLNLENSRKIWDKVTADMGQGKELKGEDGFKKCLQFTLYRPRDIISLLNKAFFEALSKNRNTLVMDDIDTAAKYISKARLDDLQKEYNTIIPSIRPVVNLFMGGNTKNSYENIVSIVETFFASSHSTLSEKEKIDYSILQGDGILRSLYSVGFLGIYDHQSNIYTFCHDGRNPDREFHKNDSLLVHPCYWIALNLSKNALSPDDAEQINDEYEIQVTSIAPEIRAQRIGQLCAALGNISDGRDNSTDFEQWCLETLKLIFSAHLDNFSLHPNGNATQRRDIVATNIEGSAVWKRIRNDYQVRQIVFEVKNYKDLSLDEYRQMASYLVKSYGRLGFIVTKADQIEPKNGADLDWCKEIYNTQDKLIIKITAKFLVKIISKLRNPEKYDIVDRSIAQLLDNYERKYLGHKSVR